ncbi:MAG: LuxR C-terminal-related transcriptional regulator [Candidatus Thioglobus sp.]|uniref:helix-turn-helix transcriptional regulator n=1 Tax=Candidatus Thioglobus sp. TaxID=2026721 RepID=UPI002638F896|nr:LuxR family transcriptional regulator [Candidatus Thioglobus sp.]MDC9727066.1 LuxR C-terminal-related transcriptional regulator [Candidatus Thioglobus sp.]
MTQTTSNLYSHVAQLNQCVNIDQIKQVCQQYLRTTGVEFFKYNWQPPAMTRLDNIAFWTCSEQWMSCYQQQNYAQKDPKTRYADNHHLPIFWDANLIKQQLAKEQTDDIDFWQDSLDLGVAHGVTIPIRGVAGSKGSLCVALDIQIDGELLLPHYEVWAMYVHSHVERVCGLEQLSEPLSKRELEVLKWTAVGESCAQTAQRLFISNNTVLFHLRNLRKKLGVVNKHQMIARALSLNLVEL